MTLLALEGVDKVFGGLHALRGIRFTVERGAIFGLIGPNGAGKTTLFNVITGVYRPDAGRVLFDGQDVSGRGSVEIAALGIARTFQNIRLFRSMTVRENVMVAGHHLHRAGLFGEVFRTARYLADEAALFTRASDLLELMGLSGNAGDVAGSLPYGSQRRLEIARALMLEPKLLLLDEPAAGMNSSESRELERQIRALRDDLGVTVVLVEHNMSVVMSVCERIHVVDHGETIAEGPPETVKSNKAVLAAYLGEEVDADAPSAGASA